jgi:hypothetical protein
MRRIRKEELTFAYADPQSTLRRDIDTFVRALEPTGVLPRRPTHHFCALTRLNRIVSAQILGGTCLWNKRTLLGEENYSKERYFARGATKRNYKKNIPSWMISRTVKWMVQNTQYRIFWGMNSPEYNEYGKVYKSSNWIHLGDSFGDTTRPPKGKWLYFKGASKKEDKELLKAFHTKYPHLVEKECTNSR